MKSLSVWLKKLNVLGNEKKAKINTKLNIDVLKKLLYPLLFFCIIFKYFFINILICFFLLNKTNFLT